MICYNGLFLESVKIMLFKFLFDVEGKVLVFLCWRRCSFSGVFYGDNYGSV